MLDKIKAEIEQIIPDELPCNKRTPEHIRDMALEIVEKYADQEPCDDVVSRQAVLDLLEDTNNGWIINEVSQLPSVRPQEPKTGHWIRHEHGFWSWVNKDGERDGWIPDYECSECASRAWKCETNYCPQCGAKMERSKNNG